MAILSFNLIGLLDLERDFDLDGDCGFDVTDLSSEADVEPLDDEDEEEELEDELLLLLEDDKFAIFGYASAPAQDKTSLPFHRYSSDLTVTNRDRRAISLKL